MKIYNKRTSRMDFSINESRKVILIKQKWKYSWLNAPGTSNWTYDERKEFHSKVDRLIWSKWGSHFYLKVKGSSAFSKKHINTKWNVNFDLEWVMANEHWTVNVTKYPSSHTTSITSSVDWNNRVVKLDTLDTSLRKIPLSGIDYFQYPVAHEFGHAAGNSIFANTGMHGDEYKTTSPYLNDKNSIMNAGMQLRDRHLDFVLSQLNTMISNSTFSIY